MVRLELTRLSTPEPKSGAAANYATFPINHYGVEGEIRTHDFTDLQSGALDHSATSTSYFGAPGRTRTGKPSQRKILSLLSLPISPPEQFLTQ